MLDQVSFALNLCILPTALNLNLVILGLEPRGVLLMTWPYNPNNRSLFSWVQSFGFCKESKIRSTHFTQIRDEDKYNCNQTVSI